MADQSTDPNYVKVPLAVKKALAAKHAGIDSGALLNEIIEQWGGVPRLARDMVEEFQGAARGSFVRQKMLSMIQSLVINNTNNDIGRLKLPSDMTHEELVSSFLRLSAKLQGATDATPTEEAEARPEDFAWPTDPPE